MDLNHRPTAPKTDCILTPLLALTHVSTVLGVLRSTPELPPLVLNLLLHLL